MEVTNGEVYNSVESLQILAQMRLPVLVSLQVAKLTIKLREQVNVIEQVRNKLIETYGGTNEEGLMEVIFPGDLHGRPASPDHTKYTSERIELMAKKEVIEVEKIQLPSEIDGKPLQIEPSILIDLEKFIDIVG